jgi:hypothetical protein
MRINKAKADKRADYAVKVAEEKAATVRELRKIENINRLRLCRLDTLINLLREELAPETIKQETPK